MKITYDPNKLKKNLMYLIFSSLEILTFVFTREESRDVFSEIELLHSNKCLFLEKGISNSVREWDDEHC